MPISSAIKNLLQCSLTEGGYFANIVDVRFNALTQFSPTTFKSLIANNPFKFVVQRLAFPVFLMLLSMVVAKAQDTESLNSKTLKLRPLEELTDLALQNAPALKANQVDFLRQTLTWKTQKGSWADMITLNGSTLYGNGSILDANNSGLGTTYVVNERKNFNFNVSLGLRLSAGEIFNRGKKSEIQRLQLDRLKQDRELTEQNLREVIAVLYTQLELAIKIVRLKAEALENQRVTFAIAEKFFKEGNYQPADYSAMLGKVTTAEEQYEQAKSEAKKFTLVLKNLVGTSVF